MRTGNKLNKAITIVVVSELLLILSFFRRLSWAVRVRFEADPPKNRRRLGAGGGNPGKPNVFTP